MNDALAGFSLGRFEHEGLQRPVYERGEGPAILIAHEIPGITPEVAGFARKVADAGFHVALPSLFGTPGRPLSAASMGHAFAQTCIRKEFRAFAKRDASPVTDWLRALARTLHARHGGPGVGFVGMCFTGNFALAMMAEPAVLAPVLSQPSLPLGISRASRRALHVSDADLAVATRRARTEGCGPIALRFTGDRLVPGERFAALREAFGEDVVLVEIDSSRGNAHGISMVAHSVLTNDLVPEAGHPTQDALEQVLRMFRERLAGPT